MTDIEVVPGVMSGTHCPTCGQFCKLYKRSINAQMAQALIIMVGAEPEEDLWVNLPRALEARGVPQGGGDAAKLRYWALITPRPGERDDGSWRTGWWRPTSLGVAFAQDMVKLPKYALVYNDKLVDLVGEQRSIIDCLGNRFDYSELMGWHD